MTGADWAAGTIAGVAVNWLAVAFIAFLVVQRLGELVLARRNTRRLMAEGAREVGAQHYPLIVALHAGWLVCILLFGHDRTPSLPWFVAFAVLQGLRLWILASLGRRWTTRIVVTDAPLVRTGPFRWVKHPNYMLVVAEIVVAPMVLGLMRVAVVFTLLNALALAIRIRAEEAALAPLRS